MKLKQVLAASILGASLLGTHAMANSIDVNVSDDSIGADVEFSLNRENSLLLGAGVLYSEEYSRSSTIGNVSFQAAETKKNTYHASVGAKLYAYSDPGSNTGTALAFGGSFYHVIPTLERVSAGGSLFAAPSVTSFGKTKRLYDANARIAFRVIQNADVYLGYRQLKLKNNRGFNKALEKGFHLGVRATF